MSMRRVTCTTADFLVTHLVLVAAHGLLAARSVAVVQIQALADLVVAVAPGKGRVAQERLMDELVVVADLALPPKTVGPKHGEEAAPETRESALFGGMVCWRVRERKGTFQERKRKKKGWGGRGRLKI
jgi:hypothetical protein